MKIETKRLILRPARNSDWKDFVDACNDFQLASMTSSTPHPYKKEDAIKSIKRNIKNWNSKKKEVYSWLIELKKENKVIGKTGIFNLDPNMINAETGSWINRRYWRKGYITEAKIPVIDFAFNKLKLKKLITVAFVDNKASNAMSKRLGFRLVGKLRKHEMSLATKRIHDSNIYELLKEDWKRVRPKLINHLNKKLK